MKNLSWAGKLGLALIGLAIVVFIAAYFLGYFQSNETEARAKLKLALDSWVAQTEPEQFQKAKEATATAGWGATSVTDYGQEPRGLAPYSEISKASLRSLVRNMSSAALEEKCQTDPSFKKALDSLE